VESHVLTGVLGTLEPWECRLESGRDAVLRRDLGLRGLRDLSEIQSSNQANRHRRQRCAAIRTRGVVQLLASLSSPHAVHLDPLPPVDQLIVPTAARKPASARSPQRGHMTSSPSSVVTFHPSILALGRGRRVALPPAHPSAVNRPRVTPTSCPVIPTQRDQPPGRRHSTLTGGPAVAPIVAPSLTLPAAGYWIHSSTT
jgi:hypothetical protein